MRTIIIIALLAISQTSFAFNVKDHPKWFFDFNVASYHNQDLFYTEETFERSYMSPYRVEPIKYTVTEIVETPFNENNFGIGIRYEVRPNIDLSVGFYDNSFYKTSIYAGAEFHTLRSRWISIGVAFGLVSGYQGTPTPSTFLVLPVVQLGPPQMGVRLGYMPVGEVKFGTMQFYLGF